MVKRSKPNRVDLKSIFLGLQSEMATKLKNTRANVRHATAKGNVTETSWRKMLGTYLPKRYAVETAFIIDSEGNISEQIDLVIFDRHFSPFLFHEDGAVYIPAESVYAVFEIKQDGSKANLLYAAKKAESVRKLKRTSTTITHAGGSHAPVVPKELLAGFLALSEGGNGKGISSTFIDNLKSQTKNRRLNLVCVLERGAVDVTFGPRNHSKFVISPPEQALIGFFLALLSKLQALGSVPAMDIPSYGASLKSK